MSTGLEGQTFVLNRTRNSHFKPVYNGISLRCSCLVSCQNIGDTKTSTTCSIAEESHDIYQVQRGGQHETCSPTTELYSFIVASNANFHVSCLCVTLALFSALTYQPGRIVFQALKFNPSHLTVIRQGITSTISYQLLASIEMAKIASLFLLSLFLVNTAASHNVKNIAARGYDMEEFLT